MSMAERRDDAPISLETVGVDLGDRSYDILIGPGLIDRAGELVSPFLRRPRTIVVADAAVAALHGKRLLSALTGAGIAAEMFEVPSGEASKSFAQLEPLLRRILSHGIERRDCLIAFGGGVVGDLAGFAAAVALRGIDFIQMPTTLLAQVDSSVGGKTGIDVPEGKNLVGAFHQPRLVLADTGVLDTLPPRELKAGFAEIVKMGLLGDAGFFDWLATHGAAVLAREPEALATAIRISCEGKARIVAEDEKESGRRALLNLGHTFAHALEAEIGFDGSLLHGEAVSIGLALAFELSARLQLCPGESVGRVTETLRGFGMPTRPADLGLDFGGDPTLASATLIDHMGRDKKVEDGKLSFVLVRDIGEAFKSQDVPLPVLRDLLEEALAV